MRGKHKCLSGNTSNKITGINFTVLSEGQFPIEKILGTEERTTSGTKVTKVLSS